MLHALAVVNEPVDRSTAHGHSFGESLNQTSSAERILTVARKQFQTEPKKNQSRANVMDDSYGQRKGADSATASNPSFELHRDLCYLPFMRSFETLCAPAPRGLSADDSLAPAR